MTLRQYLIRCYRKTPGDAGCNDIPVFGPTLEGCLIPAEQMLLAWFNNAKRGPSQRPLMADLQDEHGNVAARIRVIDAETTERIADGPSARCH